VQAGGVGVGLFCSVLDCVIFALTFFYGRMYVVFEGKVLNFRVFKKRSRLFGEMQEWLNWLAWKASIPQKGIGGSNPPFSAGRLTPVGVCRK
jgi:hypothetical protein